MYVHIGGECTITDQSILGIFDFDALTADSGDSFLSFIKETENAGLLETIPGSLPMSVVLTATKVYLSPLSPDVLRQRLEKQNKLVAEQK